MASHKSKLNCLSWQITQSQQMPCGHQITMPNSSISELHVNIFLGQEEEEGRSASFRVEDLSDKCAYGLHLSDANGSRQPAALRLQWQLWKLLLIRCCTSSKRELEISSRHLCYQLLQVSKMKVRCVYAELNVSCRYISPGPTTFTRTTDQHHSATVSVTAA